MSQIARPRSASVIAWSSVGLLSVLYALGMMDRIMLAMIINPIKADFGIGDFQVGLLMGLAFSVTYVILGVPLGLTADRVPRKFVIFGGLLVWSLATLGSAFAAGFFSLFLFRMALGVGEAALSPAAVPLISSLFPQERRSLPLSIYMASSNVGAAVAAVSVGFLLLWITQQGNMVPLIGVEIRPWQFVFLCMAVPGFLLLPAVLLLPDPPRLRETRSAPGLKPLYRFLGSRKRLFVPLFITFALSVTVNYSFSYWSAEFLMRGHGWTKAQAGALMGFMFFVPPLLSHLISGISIDWLAAKGVRDAPLRLFLFMALLSLPFSLMAYLAANSTLTVIGLAVIASLFYPSLSFGTITIQQVTPDDLKGQMTGAFLSFTNFFGLGIGPALVGFLSQHAFDGTGALGTSLAMIVSLGILLVCFCLALCLGPLREAVGASKPSSAAEHLEAVGADQA